LFDLGAVQAALRWLGLSARDSAPTAWDAAFEPGRPGAWLYVYVRGLEEPLIGEFGKGSIAGASPYAHDLFLKRRYEIVDGKFVPIASIDGLWIAGELIEYIEFLEGDQPKEVSDAEGRDKGHADQHQ
jgi:hypothetical protein